jgi:formyltetrahydrofolate-dependent phosphoribosylglycinamide formyltransferase
MGKARVAVMVGPKGRGSNMAALAAACAAGKVDAEIAVVIAPKEGSPALDRASELGLKTAVVEPGDGFGERLLAAFEGCQIVCLAGFLRLLPPDVLAAFPDRVLNIHPALLPKFGGKGMYGHHVHEAVLAAGESESGCTVHLVTEKYDEGRILVQKRCTVLPEDTPDTLAARVLELEHAAYPEALLQVVEAFGSAPSNRRFEPRPEDAPASDKEPEQRLSRGALPKELRLQHPLFTHVAIPIMRALCWVLFTLLGPFRSPNRKAIPRSGGLIILSNHRADVDPIAVQLACPRPIYFMAKSELFSMPVIGWLMRGFRAFPVKRGEPDRNALKKAAAYTHAGQVVCLFPEGQLTETGELQALKPGAALIVRMAGTPVICCGLKRTDAIMPYGKVLPRPALGWVTCSWGEPHTFDKHSNAEEILDWVEAELRRLTA